jgi:nucleoside-diphosphate-sugar epimerase
VDILVRREFPYWGSALSKIVFGASGMVGGYIAEHLAKEGERVIGVSRAPRDGWLTADLAKPETLTLPAADVIFCAANARTFSLVMPQILAVKPQRVVVISSSSVFTKLDSKDESERRSILELVEAESRIMAACEAENVEWTILRPTLIYKEGRDSNVTQLARIISRLRFMPLYGSATGLRQPVHAEDLARGAIAAGRSPSAANRAYFANGETLTYREMVGRIFDSMLLPRRMVSLPPAVWQCAFALARPLYPNVTPVMGERMLKDLCFDSSPAVEDFGWNARPFAPSFR